VGLAGGDYDADGQTLGVGASVDLGGQAAARAAERVGLGPPFPPAAQWCARTMVESIICRAVSDTSLPASASRITSHTPLSAQRRNCRQTEFHLPSSSGRDLMTDAEWAYFGPFLVRGRGRPPRNHRRVLDAIFWMMRTGAPWRDVGS
jgi:hypothetical protein